MILAGRCSDAFSAYSLPDKPSFRITYYIVIALIIISSICYRVHLLGNLSSDITGKMSLYENAMVGGTPQPEYDLLSIVYSSILRFILLFTGNIISVPFYYQTACFAIFMVCGFLTVHKLLGYAAAFVFTAYVAYMPVFTPHFTGLLLSTDYLFMAMFGIELLAVALFLRGAYKGTYTSSVFILWYLLVGVVVGFMAYLDAGTIIMILPFLLAILVMHRKNFKEEATRLLWVVFAAVVTFTAMFCQEQGVIMANVRLASWASYYFHNLNTFSMFWAYTDYKFVYLITVIVMSGVIVGFWKNRHIEKISPWLLSMLFIFATVPFMGPTRMNTQVFVTVYYAFILGCVASLITLPADEGDEEFIRYSAQPETGSTTDGVASVLVPEYEFEADDEDEATAKADAEVKESYQADNESEENTEEEVAENQEASEADESIEDDQPEENDLEESTDEEVPQEAAPLDENESAETPAQEEEYSTESSPDTDSETAAPESDQTYESEAEEEPESESDEEYENDVDSETTYEPEESVSVEEPTDDTEPETTSDSETTHNPDEAPAWAPRKRYVPEGMVLPEDDEDMDQTPRMKMPSFTGTISLTATAKAVSEIIQKEAQQKDDTAPSETDYDYNKYGFSKNDTPKRFSTDDFDVDLRPGDDFDI
jgi:MFS family permease